MRCKAPYHNRPTPDSSHLNTSPISRCACFSPSEGSMVSNAAMTAGPSFCTSGETELIPRYLLLLPLRNIDIEDLDVLYRLFFVRLDVFNPVNDIQPLYGAPKDGVLVIKPGLSAVSMRSRFRS